MSCSSKQPFLEVPYTLDGTRPDFFSTPYTGPVLLTRDVTLWAIAYSADFQEASEGLPVQFIVPANERLLATTPGGGTVAMDPPEGYYPTGFEVRATATPLPGWKFIGWTGDAAGTNQDILVTMDRPKHVRAIFGTTVNVVAAAGGTVNRSPLPLAGNLYPYGSSLRLSAVPHSTNYFALWGGALAGNTNNPATLNILSANPSVSALFPPLPNGYWSLAVSASGAGRVATTPRGTRFANGQTVTVTATPDAGQEFLGWSGDASGTDNPLTVSMTGNRVITATFTSKPRLHVELDPNENGTKAVRLYLTTDLGTTSRVYGSADLQQWEFVREVINVSGTTLLTDPAAPNPAWRFYRVESP